MELEPEYNTLKTALQYSVAAINANTQNLEALMATLDALLPNFRSAFEKQYEGLAHPPASEKPHQTPPQPTLEDQVILALQRLIENRKA